MSKFIFVYSTFATKTEAEKISQGLIKKKLAACVNIYPIDSIYRWQGKIEKNKEWAGFIKTKKDNYKKIEKYILANHTYDTPCIEEIEVNRLNKKYSTWLNSCLKQ